MSGVKLGHLFRVGMGQTILREDLTEEGFPVISATEGDHYFGRLRTPAIVLTVGDLVVTARGTIGQIKRVREPSTSTQTTIWLKNRSPSKVSADYIAYVLSAGRAQYFPATTTAIPMLTVAEVSACVIDLPSAEEQCQRVRYLDAETAEIDAFIADQERLIELLIERRQAIVVDELDRISASSGLMRRRIGDSVKIISGYPFDASQFGELGEPVIRIRDLNQAVSATRYLGEDFPPAVRVTGADVLVGMDGDFNIGRWKGEEAGLLNQRMLALRSNEVHLLRWLEYVLPPVLMRINDLTYSTTVKHLAIGQVRSAFFERPKGEGVLVSAVNQLDAITDSLEEALSDAREAIALSKERRAALISAAVTGRIDVTEGKRVLV